MRPSSPNQREMNGLYTYPGGRIAGKGCTVQYLIMVAFNLQQFQISGGPEWINLLSGDHFDLEAKPSETSASARSNPALAKLPPNEEQRAMLQSLLAERFQLRFHRDAKEGSVYVLTKSRGPLQLVAPKDPKAFPWAGGITGGWFGGGMRGENISMPQLAARLSRFLERPVLDRTGIDGSYDFEFRFGGDDNDADIPGFLMTAMNGIGLNVKPAKGLVETLVVDHVEHPSEN